MQPARIVVVGSINMDLVVRAPRMPRPGQTLTGSDFLTAPGGKGANQAVAAARLGADVAMIGRVGDDVFADRLVRGLQDAGVHTDHVLRTADCPSGTAVITVDDSGENSIIVVPGSNGQLTPADIEAREQLIADAHVLLLQLEVPLETVVRAAQIARGHGVRVIVDPAPAPTQALPAQLHNVDIISPNQSEAAALTGQSAQTVEQAEAAAGKLVDQGAGHAVIKLGAAGALAVGDDRRPIRVAGFKVDPVDTTAAGDAFTAALGLALAEGRDLAEAMTFGCATGALAVTKMGAQQAMPDRAAVEQLIDQTGAARRA